MGPRGDGCYENISRLSARARARARARGCISNLFLQKAALVSSTLFLVIKLSKCFVVIRPIVRSSLFSVLVHAEVASLF